MGCGASPCEFCLSRDFSQTYTVSVVIVTAIIWKLLGQPERWLDRD
jgi:hypothetical protein